MLPIVHGLEREFGERIDFVRVNILIPENKTLMEQYSFSTTPEFYLVDPQGEIIGFWGDAFEEAELRQAFEEALGE